MGVLIRQLGLGDWPQWRELRLAALRTDPQAFASRAHDWVDASAERWQVRLAPPSVCVIAEVDGRAVGQAAVNRLVDHPHLESMWVAPEARDTGVGAALVADLRARVDGPLTLQVMADNQAARALYERCGFVAESEDADHDGCLTMVAPPLTS